MANIHVLPTDKPSNLLLCLKDYVEHENTPAENFDIKGKFTLGYGKYANGEFYQQHHIYITSDEEIKTGDEGWCYTTGSHFTNSGKGRITKEVINQNGKNGLIFKKIILTTNQYLIKEAVQAIDDEFLEWFIKNPTCEEVEIFYQDVYSMGKWDRRLKIIIPKEDLGYTTNLGVEVSDEMARALMIPKELFGLRQFVGSSSKYKDEDFSASLSDEMGQWLRPNKVTRVEVIQHSPPYNGRAYTNYDAKDVEVQYQDDGKTLKIFLK